jgi:hypothetical protein
LAEIGLFPLDAGFNPSAPTTKSMGGGDWAKTVAEQVANAMPTAILAPLFHIR